ncbi:MAG: lysostaphin resistance A-like protein [Limisphaerales bacterium]
MRLLVALAIYILFVFVGGALVAPGLHSIAQWGAEQFPAVEKLAYQPFHRYVNRCFMVIAIVGLLPLSKIAKLSLADTGWVAGADRWKLLRKGLFVGFVSLAIPAALCVLVGERNLYAPPTFSKLLTHFGNAIGAAVLVSILEESVFRGVVFGSLKKHTSLPLAVGITSGIYALVHFFERTRHEGEVLWSSGLALLPKMMRGFGEWDMIVPGFFSLTVAGIILAMAVRTSGSLYFSIGLHAGWIFWLKSYKFFTRPVDENHALFWGSGKLIDGWIAFIVLVGVWVVLSKRNFLMATEVKRDEPTDTRSD